jgi:hypothetical protein
MGSCAGGVRATVNDDQVEDEMGKACSGHNRDDKCIYGVRGENKENDRLENLAWIGK